jgi:hypothetical protein
MAKSALRMVGIHSNSVRLLLKPMPATPEKATSTIIRIAQRTIISADFRFLAVPERVASPCSPAALIHPLRKSQARPMRGRSHAMMTSCGGRLLRGRRWRCRAAPAKALAC